LSLQTAGLAFIVCLSIFAARRRWLRVLGLSALAFLILLAPSSSIVPSRDVAFEHRLYLPMAAFAVFVADIIGRMPRRTLVAAPLLAVLAMLTVARGSVWGSDVSLWEDTVKKAPGKARAWFNLGGALLKTDRVRAREALLKATELQPVFPEAYYDLGVIEQDGGNAALAVVYYNKAIQQRSDYWPAWNNLGNTLFAVGQIDKATQALESTLRLNPDYWPAHYNLAVILFKTGRFDAAIPRLKIVLDWQPDFRDARYLFAVALTQAGHRNAADAQWKELERFGGASPTTPTFIPAPVRP
jgi:tetratricopeptide (TPR) repeat protein